MEFFTPVVLPLFGSLLIVLGMGFGLYGCFANCCCTGKNKGKEKKGNVEIGRKEAGNIEIQNGNVKGSEDTSSVPTVNMENFKSVKLKSERQITIQRLAVEEDSASDHEGPTSFKKAERNILGSIQLCDEEMDAALAAITNAAGVRTEDLNLSGTIDIVPEHTDQRDMAENFFRNANDDVDYLVAKMNVNMSKTASIEK